MNDEFAILDPELANAIISGDVARLHTAMEAMLLSDVAQREGDIKSPDLSPFMPASKEEPKKLTRETAATLAVKSESPEMLAEVTAAGANIHLANSEGHTPISIAACRNLPGAIRALCIQGANISEATTGFKKDSPLGWAVKNDSCAAAAELLDLGAKPVAATPGEPSPLSVSMTTSRSGEMTELLLSFGADPNKADKQGNTPLHAAALNTNVAPRALAILLDAGPKNSVNDEGQLAIKVAEDMTNTTFANVTGSHPMCVPPRRITPSHPFLVTLNDVASHAEVLNAASLRMIDAVKTGDMPLLRNECSRHYIEPQKDEALSPLFAAVEARNAPAIRLLATLGMGTYDTDRLGNTPLHRFVEQMDQSSPRELATLDHLASCSYLRNTNSAGITAEMRARDLGKSSAAATILSRMPAAEDSMDGEPSEKGRAPLAEGTEPIAVGNNPGHTPVVV